MMMPANYSAIAENEMTYVIGGGVQVGSLGVASTLTSNIMTIVGNSFMSPLIKKTLGVMFGGKWGVADTLYNKDGEKEVRNTVFANIFSGYSAASQDDYGAGKSYSLAETAHYGYSDGDTGFRGVVNAGMQVVGGLMALAQLSVVDVDPIADATWFADGSIL